MKLLVFSDIHGSEPAARKIADLTRSHMPDAVLLLGDILYHGPRNPLPEGYDPRAVVEILAPLKSRIIAVRGNCDSEVDQMVLPFPLAPDFAWVLDGPLRIFACHGHRHTQKNLPPLEEGDVFLYGHTHVPTAASTPGGIYLCNPGSLSLPKEEHPPCYGLFDYGAFCVLTDEGELYLKIDCM